MYCIQFLLPVLLLPRPLHPNQLFEHSLFLGKSQMPLRNVLYTIFSSLRILGISGNTPVPDLFDNISGLLGRFMLQLPWWMYFTPPLQLLKLPKEEPDGAYNFFNLEHLNPVLNSREALCNNPIYTDNNRTYKNNVFFISDNKHG